jgi:hypothetical protein
VKDTNDDRRPFVIVNPSVPAAKQHISWCEEQKGKVTIKRGWPVSSAHACWHCCHTFTEPPVGVPTRYNDKLDHFTLVGNFCSLDCASTYMTEAHCSAMQRSWFVLLARRLMKGTKWQQWFQPNPRFRGFNHAPPRIALKMFGGPLSIEEFRKNQYTVTRAMPLAPTVHLTWPEAQLTVQSHGQNLTLARPETPIHNKQNLALQRATPMRKHITLDAFIGRK